MMPQTLITDSAPALFGILLFVEAAAALYIATNRGVSQAGVKDFLQLGFVVAGIGAFGGFVFGTITAPIGTACLWLLAVNFVAAFIATVWYNRHHYDQIVKEEQALK